MARRTRGALAALAALARMPEWARRFLGALRRLLAVRRYHRHDWPGLNSFWRTSPARGLFVNPAMQVYYDDGLENPEPRLHPYQAARPYADGQPDPKGFLDFVANPELIETSLEDFMPYGHTAAVRTFYDLLRWANGPESPLATCDCGTRPPSSHKDRNSHRPIRIHGRLFFLFRDLKLNCSAEHTDWLCGYAGHVLKAIDPGLPAHDAVVGFTLQPVLHITLSTGTPLPDGGLSSGPGDPGLGRHLMLTWFAYGDTEADAFTMLDRTFKNIWSALRSTADEIRRGVEASNK